MDPGNEGTMFTVYFDSSCALCAAEMANLRALDVHGRIGFIDCSAPDFEDPTARACSIDRASLMQSLHVRDVTGRWYRGVDAMALLYVAVGATGRARFCAHPFLRPLTLRIYPWVARHRQQLSSHALARGLAPVLRLVARHRPQPAQH
jgi:predicted DCC family thiol-disulfide oxidoreductase YuxK